MRICTFLPSATEIVYMLGLGDSLHGVSHECDFPPGAIAKPKVVRSRFDPDTLSSGEIDALVTDMMMRGENIYQVDREALTDARPDLVITQQLCEVCAVSFEDVQQAVECWTRLPLSCPLTARHRRRSGRHSARWSVHRTRRLRPPHGIQPARQS